MKVVLSYVWSVTIFCWQGDGRYPTHSPHTMPGTLHSSTMSLGKKRQYLRVLGEGLGMLILLVYFVYLCVISRYISKLCSRSTPTTLSIYYILLSIKIYYAITLSLLNLVFSVFHITVTGRNIPHLKYTLKILDF